MSGGKFGFIPEDEEPGGDLALQFEPTPIQRPQYPVEDLDRAARAAGFASREPAVIAATPRRRRIQREPATRALAIRMTESQFTRFLRYADGQQLTYNETISHLLDLAGEPE